MKIAPSGTGSDSSNPPESPRTWLWLAGLTIMAAALRVIGINKCLWWDEIYSLVISVRHPLARNCNDISYRDPTYFLLCSRTGEHSCFWRTWLEPALARASLRCCIDPGSVSSWSFCHYPFRGSALLCPPGLFVSSRVVFAERPRIFRARVLGNSIDIFAAPWNAIRTPRSLHCVCSCHGTRCVHTPHYDVSCGESANHLHRRRSCGLEKRIEFGKMETPAPGILYGRRIITASLRPNRDAGS